MQQGIGSWALMLVAEKDVLWMRANDRKAGASERDGHITEQSVMEIKIKIGTIFACTLTDGRFFTFNKTKCGH